MAVLTPSYRPDLALFADLHASVLAHTPDDTVHHVIVPRADRALFARFAGPRCRVRTVAEFLPRRFLALPRLPASLPGPLSGPLWANLARPWPPVRGWVLQQAVKIAATAALDADAVLLADSDAVLVRPVTPERFRADGVLRLTRMPGAVTDDPGLARHVRWHAVARELLGLPEGGPPPLPDYINPVNVWDPAVVRALQAHLEKATGLPWLDAFCARLHISEFILYGVFVDQVWAPGETTPAAGTISHNYWEHAALDAESAAGFAAALPPEAVAVMISARSATSPDLRRLVLRRCADAAR